MIIAGLAALMFVGWWLGLILLLSIIPGMALQFKLSRMQVKHWDDNIKTRRKKNMIKWRMLENDVIVERGMRS